MPNIDEIAFYNGTHTGSEIDNAITLVEQRGEISSDGNGLVTAKAVANEIIQITITGITGAGEVSGSKAIPTMGGAPNVKAAHDVLGLEFSNPNAVMGYWTVTAAANTISWAGHMAGIPGSETSSTDMTVWLGCVGGSASVAS